ncbi:MAG: hypothetical protein M1832_004081 [Thelocarpon impressellum]|nr:MAG: hypothetical protein M1832_004081 [Thelocarpon impressellum]
MQNRRGTDAWRKLSAIAPKEESTPPPGWAPGEGEGGSQRRRAPPPRSRTGCWTCRQRKVKCSEERPACAQCARLNHTCDYNPRLSFRDDTPRVRGGFRSYRRVSTAGNVVWDPAASRSRETSRTRSADGLPPFSRLRTDEERERKAETYDPGTFHVVVNPDSFCDLPEYKEDGPVGGERRSGEPSSFRERAAHGTDGESEDDASSSGAGSDDPHVVILRHFEEAPRRGASHASTKPSTSPTSPSTSPATLAPGLGSLAVSSNEPLQARARMADRRGGPDARLVAHYKEYLSPHLLWTHRREREDDIFELEASRFPPLYHAMMALSSLSLAYRERVRSADALQHYQQALPSLNSTITAQQDITSDGVLFTHFFLLLYEVAAAEQGSSNLWLIHLTRLSDILQKRHELHGYEKHSFITTTVCTVDTFAVLSSCSGGDFFSTMLKGELLPSVAAQLPPLGTGSDAGFYPKEQEMFTAAVIMTQRITHFACQLGRLAKEIRADGKRPLYPDDARLMSVDMQHAERRRRVGEAREALRLEWVTAQRRGLPGRGPHGVSGVPLRVRSILVYAMSLHRACIIYSYTSMWASQRSTATADGEAEVEACASAILDVAEGHLGLEGFDLRLVLFALFMAGCATTAVKGKVLALELLRRYEEASLAPNASVVRQLLEKVYQRQEHDIRTVGHAAGVDWVAVMMENRLQVVKYGL